MYVNRTSYTDKFPRKLPGPALLVDGVMPGPLLPDPALLVDGVVPDPLLPEPVLLVGRVVPGALLPLQSSLTMVTVPAFPSSVAPAALLRTISNLSSSSQTTSPIIETLILFIISPGAKVIEPFAAT